MSATAATIRETDSVVMVGEADLCSGGGMRWSHSGAEQRTNLEVTPLHAGYQHGIAMTILDSTDRLWFRLSRRQWCTTTTTRCSWPSKASELCAQTARDMATIDCIWIAFYYLLRPGEYANATGDAKHPFRLQDMQGDNGRVGSSSIDDKFINLISSER